MAFNIKNYLTGDPSANMMDYEKKKAVDWKNHIKQSGGKLTEQNYPINRFLQDTKWENSNTKPQGIFERAARKLFSPPTKEGVNEQKAYQDYVQSSISSGKTAASVSEWKKTYTPNSTIEKSIPKEVVTPLEQKPAVVLTDPSGTPDYKKFTFGPPVKPLVIGKTLEPTKGLIAPNSTNPTVSPSAKIVTPALKVKSAPTSSVAPTGRVNVSLIKPPINPLIEVKTDATAILNNAPVRPGAPESETQQSAVDIAIQEYGQQLDDVNKRANIVDGTKALGNIASLVSAYNLDDPKDLVAPTVKSAKLLSPGQYLRDASMDEIDKQVNTSNRILAETGKSEAIVGNTANAMEASNKVNTEAVVQDINTANQQSQLDVNADNANAIAKTEAYNKNIERKLQYNMLKGQGMTEALNALGEQGTQFVNRMGQTAYGKWQAKMSGEEAKMMQNYTETQAILNTV